MSFSESTLSKGILMLSLRIYLPQSGSGIISGLLISLSIASTIIPLSILAHVGIHEEIQEATHRINNDPQNARLYLFRADLYRIHRDWLKALEDFDKARQLEPGLAEVDLGTGMTYYDQERYSEAVVTLTSFLNRKPDHVRGLVTRAQALGHLGDYLPASADYTRAIAQFEPPRKPIPEYYLGRARTLAAAGDQYIKVALDGLDEGLVVLGNIVTLELYAIELEVKRNNYDAALQRLDSIIARSVRKESWLVKRGEILMRAGRAGQARKDFVGARAAIDALPSKQRATGYVDKLKMRIDRKLQELGQQSAQDSN